MFCMKNTERPEYRLIVARLIEARQNAGLSQAAAATAIGKPPSYIAKVELCERRMDILEMKQLSLIYGVAFKSIIKELL